jgi:hypothetical protein
VVKKIKVKLVMNELVSVTWSVREKRMSSLYGTARAFIEEYEGEADIHELQDFVLLLMNRDQEDVEDYLDGLELYEIEAMYEQAMKNGSDRIQN